uniref:TM2 domain-containing protein n=1 Tax=Amphimedon queenslandica TaxID=400682 RepID=A0A1X7VTE6_AMPQE
MHSSLLLAISFFSLSLVAGTPLGSESIDIQTRQSRNCSFCFPPGVTTVPTSLIDCPNDRCACTECFSVNTTANVCEYTVPSPSDCYYYNEATLQCIDNRKSQVTAFALSLTLSGFGVANFYIGQNGLGAGQLVLFLSIFVIVYIIACTPCCAICCFQAENIKGSIVFICFMLVMILLIIAISFGITGWWIADAVIFGTNKRDAGDGCPLKPDL